MPSKCKWFSIYGAILGPIGTEQIDVAAKRIKRFVPERHQQNYQGLCFRSQKTPKSQSFVTWTPNLVTWNLKGRFLDMKKAPEPLVRRLFLGCGGRI
uniref:Uncharacterized protein n=1 Tax=uncultured alpha proteobacterium HF0130_06E21 TaxID=710808 RepID=E0XT16_9PROT|nr:hypothetical protein [uncultured alpha proteobacterium HF0130_06E21]